MVRQSSSAEARDSPLSGLLRPALSSPISSAALSRPSTRLPLLSPSPLGPAERSRSPKLLLLSPPSLRLFFFFGRRLRSLGEFNAPSIDCLRSSSCALVRR